MHVLQLGLFDLPAHTRRVVIAKYPYLCTFGQHSQPHDHTGFTVVQVPVVQKLREQQMRREGNVALGYGEPAILAGGSDVALDVPGKGRTDEYQWAVRVFLVHAAAYFFLFLLECLFRTIQRGIGGGVSITFVVIQADSAHGFLLFVVNVDIIVS